jgi:hypothetical protein
MIRLHTALLFTLISLQSIAQQKNIRAYYVSAAGNDASRGTLTAPFKTIGKVNTISLHPGDAVYFKAGDVFKGTLVISDTKGSKAHPVIIGSYGKGRAIISADSVGAVRIYQTQFIRIRHLKLAGLGRKTGNRENGLAVMDSRDIDVDDMDISGFQKSGLLIDNSSKINAASVFVHDNGSAGITVEGRNSKKDSREICIVNCRAENNPGDPTKLDNHSGNGIVVGHCTRVLIDRCTATNNGWDMPRIGNGPVGIWCYEADSVVIQRCLSYNNKTSKGGADGGGFDLDGGVSNSIIQYCFSYGNQGSGYCLFQYWGASAWHNNVIRYNISENDGTVSDSQAGLYIWNSSDDPKQFYNCRTYGNIIYNDKVAAISFSDKSENKGFSFRDNIFVGRDTLIRGRDILGNCVFEHNNWWSLRSGFNIDGIKTLKAWANKTGKEQRNGRLTCLNENPRFKNPGHASITSHTQLKQAFANYRMPGGSKLGDRLGLGKMFKGF